jgi:hypothetical protein
MPSKTLPDKPDSATPALARKTNISTLPGGEKPGSWKNLVSDDPEHNAFWRALCV